MKIVQEKIEDKFEKIEFVEIKEKSIYFFFRRGKREHIKSMFENNQLLKNEFSNTTEKLIKL